MFSSHLLLDQLLNLLLTVMLHRLIGRWNGDVTCLSPASTGVRKVWYLKLWDSADTENASTDGVTSPNADAPSVQYRLRCTMPDNTVTQTGLVIVPKEDHQGQASVYAPHDPLLRDCDLTLSVDESDIGKHDKGPLRIHLRVHENNVLRQIHTLSLNESGSALGVCLQHFSTDGTLYSVEGGVLRRCGPEEKERRVVAGDGMFESEEPVEKGDGVQVEECHD